MLLTERQAAELLGELGLPRERARRALLAGIAGRGIRTRAATLYEEAEVRALMKPPIDGSELAPECQRGMFVARVGAADLLAPMQAQRDAVRMHWQINPWVRVHLSIRIEEKGFVPFLATMSGFVVLGGDIIGGSLDDEFGAALDLDEPGHWFDPLRGRRFLTGPGNPLLLWHVDFGRARPSSR